MRINKKIIIAVLTTVILIVLISLVYNNISIEKSGDNYQDYIPQEEVSEEQLRQTKVILYFINKESGKLESEIKVIEANKLLNNSANEIMQLLLKGPQSSSLEKIIPEGTVVHDVTVDNRCATINVSNEFLNYENEEAKMKIVNSIVNTLTNLKDVESVKFLINGEINEKIADTYVKINEEKNQ